MSNEAFVVCAMSTQSDTPVVLSAFQGPRCVTEDYFYWSTNPNTWVRFKERDNALEEGSWLLRDHGCAYVNEDTLWVMPLPVALHLLGVKEQLLENDVANSVV